MVPATDTWIARLRLEDRRLQDSLNSCFCVVFMCKKSWCEEVFCRYQNGAMFCTRTHGPGRANAANGERAWCSLGDQIEGNLGPVEGWGTSQSFY